MTWVLRVRGRWSKDNGVGDEGREIREKSKSKKKRNDEKNDCIQRFVQI